MKTTKIEATKKHLNFAIESYFQGRDILPICVVAGAANVLAHDLVIHKNVETWIQTVSDASEHSVPELLRAYRSIPNWLKHGDRDPEAVIDISTNDIELLMFTTMMDLGTLIGQEEVHSYEVSAFQLWYVSKNKHMFLAPGYLEIVKRAEDSFPSLELLSIDEQLKSGLSILIEAKSCTLK